MRFQSRNFCNRCCCCFSQPGCVVFVKGFSNALQANRSAPISSYLCSIELDYMSYQPQNKIRIVTAASLFDGHDSTLR